MKMMMDHHHDGGDEERLVYSLEEALAAVGFGKFQSLVLLYAGFGWFSEAMEVMIISLVGPAVKLEWGLSSTQESLLTTVVFAGMLIGAYSWGILSDNFGRRTGFFSITRITSGVGLLSSFSPNYTSLLILRSLVGVGLGGGHVFLSWFLEFVPASRRGMWMVVFSTFWTFGTIFEALLGWIVMPRLSWRWLLALSAIPSFVLLLFYGLVPESPRYLCTRGRTSDAHNILEKMARLNQTELPPGMLVSYETICSEEEPAPPEQVPLLFTARKRISKFGSGFSSLYVLFSSSLLQTTLLLWLLFFGNTFSYYGIVLLTSELLSQRQSECGLSILYSTNLRDDSMYMDVLITSFAELPGLLLAAIIVDKLGRKQSMAIMYVLAWIFLLPLVFHQSAILTTALLFGARMCSMGAFIIACIYAPELYPTSARATGAGVANAVGRIGGMVCPLVAVALVTDCHLKAAIILFEVVIFMVVVCSLLFRMDTKGRGLNDTVVTSSNSKQGIVAGN